MSEPKETSFNISPQTPSPGRIVFFRAGNSAEESPAIVTRVWENGLVNLTVFPDGSAPYNVGSVDFYDHPTEKPGFAWRWPPRV